MHAKTVWDVLLAGCLVMFGVMQIAVNVKQGKKMSWPRSIASIIAPLGFLCWGIGWVALPHSDLWPFMLMGNLGTVVASGIFASIFAGVKLSDLFPTFFRRRSGTDNQQPTTDN